jgi:hypothetical protein
MRRVNHLRLLVVATFLPGAVMSQGWVQTSAPTKNWQGIAMSADGSKLVAVANLGGIFTSTNFGGTWISNNAPATSWAAVTSSADGTRMAAAYAGGIQTSTNAGATWNPSAVPGYYWFSIKCSADGALLTAIGPAGNAVFASTNFGGSWKTNALPPGIYDGYSVGLSASGNRLVAGNNIGFVLISTNLGANWSLTNRLSGSFNSIAAAADGATLASVNIGGQVYCSTNAGVSWAATNLSSLGLVSIASSADGSRLVTVGGSGSVATYAFSTNSGAGWATNSQAGPVWRAVASSADGSFLASAASGGGIWVYRTVPTPRLNIAPSGLIEKLSWTLPSTNFVLQQSADLQHCASLPNSPNLNLLTLQNEVMVTPTNGRSFYRLKTP